MFKFDAILVNDEYYDFEIVKSSGNNVTKNTINFNNEKETSICSYYGSKPISQLTIPLETLENCTFLDLIND
jgi:hypothetical protein